MYHILHGSAATLGATVHPDGVNFAVFSANARQVDLCLFSADGKSQEQQLALPEKSGPIWHGFVPDLKPGTLYGYRVHGDYLPDQGHRFNPNKLLLDPYTRELSGKWRNISILQGYDNKSPEEDLSFDTRDSAAFVPKSVVSDSSLFKKLEVKAYDHYEYELIYEAHVKGLSQLHPDVPSAVRGTYEGLASDAVIEHLLSLNVSAIELLPVHSFIDDDFLLKRNLRNYWGYNSIGFFAPEPRYFGDAGLLGFKQMVQRYRDAGIDVILDVVYNHTAEGDQRGPTLSFRGLDNASYYRLQADNPRFYVNDTGCGNTVDVSNPMVLRMVLDSLRFWVECMGVSGFRFDLATTIARDHDGYNPYGAFLSAVRQDPTLAKVRLIAEPWDIGPGGYQLGGFPHPFSEWNDAYRDNIRRFWRGDEHTAQELGSRLLGSADRFDTTKRSAWASLNFISSHDGFTTADVTRYSHKHNEDNTEGNKDGHDSNYSDNCGIEGDTQDKEIIEKRSQRQRNLLATMFLSQGVPMLLGGDEISNSQSGNNNAYCQDNEIGWINWDSADLKLLEFIQKLSQFRKDNSILYQSQHLHGVTRDNDGLKDVEWTDFSGAPVAWEDSDLSQFCLQLRYAITQPNSASDDSVLLIFNRHAESSEVKLPEVPSGQHWQIEIDTSQVKQKKARAMKKSIRVQSESIQALKLVTS